jgi:hypothetical protein
MSTFKLVTAGLALLYGGALHAADQVAYQPFPKGYGYLEPGEINALQDAVKRGNSIPTREHAWRLWAGIMQPANGMDWPVWYTWPNTKGAFAAAKAEAADTAVATEAAPTRHMGRLGATTLPPNTPNQPVYDVPPPVLKAYPNVTNPKNCNGNPVCDGTHFAFNGDIMIATESLSREGFDFIRDPQQPLYQKATLDKLYNKNDPSKRVHNINAPAAYVVTKHMYWPVKAQGVTALPVWHDDFGPEYAGYAGYEVWGNAVGIDPSGKLVGRSVEVSYLYGISQAGTPKKPLPTITKKAKVYGLRDFYYHKVTQQDWDSFDDADKAILNASSYWLSNKPFGVGDYLVTMAMHINTKEIPSWGLQSVWWSDIPNRGPYAADRPKLANAKGPWEHYLLTEAYGIPEKNNPQQLPVATNPYIELVTHPVGTSCYTCHARAGWPVGASPNGTSYQNAACPDLRASLNPKSSCLSSFTLTDFQWIIPDRAK